MASTLSETNAEFLARGVGGTGMSIDIYEVKDGWHAHADSLRLTAWGTNPIEAEAALQVIIDAFNTGLARYYERSELTRFNHAN